MKLFITRFIRFSGLGVLAFILDFLLLAFLVEGIKMYYLHAAAIAFVLATTVHYTFVRKTVFRHAPRSYTQGYPYFISIGIINLGLTIALMGYAVGTVGINYLIARPAISIFIGTWNFIINAKLTFNSRLFS